MADKVPAFDRRSRFYQGLKRAGMKPGQIQHVQTLYNQGKNREAAAYMRKQGVTPYRARKTREIRQEYETLREAARAAKLRKLGTDRMMDTASRRELEMLRDLPVEELREQARSQRSHNPFWYHFTRSFFERQLGVPRRAA